MSPPRTDSVPAGALPRALWLGALKDSIPEPGNSSQDQVYAPKSTNGPWKVKYGQGLAVGSEPGLEVVVTIGE